MKAELVYSHKARIQNRFLLEMTIHRLSDAKKLIEDFKRLVFEHLEVKL